MEHRLLLLAGGAPSGGFDDLVDHPVCQSVFGSEPAITFAVGEYAFDGLPGVAGRELRHQPPHDRELLGLDCDIHRVAGYRSEWLMHEDPAVRVRRPPAGRPTAEEELRHRGREADAHGCDVAPQRLHRVVDRETGIDLAAGRVKIQRDRKLGLFRFDDEKLGADALRKWSVDRTGEHHSALLEHPSGYVVSERRGRSIGLYLG